MSKNIYLQVGLKQSKDFQVLIEASDIPVKIRISKLIGLINYTISGNLHLNSTESEVLISSTLLLKGDDIVSDWVSGFANIEEGLTENVLNPLSEKGKSVLTKLKCRIDQDQEFFTFERK